MCRCSGVEVRLITLLLVSWQEAVKTLICTRVNQFNSWLVIIFCLNLYVPRGHWRCRDNKEERSRREIDGVRDRASETETGRDRDKDLVETCKREITVRNNCYKVLLNRSNDLWRWKSETQRSASSQQSPSTFILQYNIMSIHYLCTRQSPLMVKTCFLNRDAP